jgi:ubiquinone/menaquinone biosynthesis C-methylase UbiE
MPSLFRRVLKTMHPEGIPRLGAIIYRAVSKTGIFQAGYELLARDILTWCNKGRILDVGTGPGDLLLKIIRMRPEMQLNGLDISPAMVAIARENIEKSGFSSSIDISEGEAGNLPFPAETFDSVVSTGSLHHWKEPVAGLNEIYRVLKPGGYALIYDIATDTPKSALKELSAEYGRLRTTLLWLHTFEEPFYNRRDMEALAGSTLFERGRTRFVSVFCCLVMKRD